MVFVLPFHLLHQKWSNAFCFWPYGQPDVAKISWVFENVLNLNPCQAGNRAHSLEHSLGNSLTHGLGRSLEHGLQHCLENSLQSSLEISLEHSLEHSLKHGLGHSQEHGLGLENSLRRNLGHNLEHSPLHSLKNGLAHTDYVVSLYVTTIRKYMNFMINVTSSYSG